MSGRKGRLRVTAAALCALMLLAFVPRAEAAVAWGSRGEQVSQVQRKLKQWGYYDGAVDSVFGQATYNAVVRFQKKNGLTADGVVGARTAAARGLSLTGTVAASSSAAS